jgi:hypothetical protein
MIMKGPLSAGCGAAQRGSSRYCRMRPHMAEMVCCFCLASLIEQPSCGPKWPMPQWMATPAFHGSAACARPRVGPGTALRAITTHKIAKTSASGPKMKFSQRLCEMKLGTAPSAMTTARNHVPQRNSGALPRVPQTPARPSTISAAAT